jgi:hypothetical protein
MTLDPLSRPGLDLLAAIDVLDRHGIRWVMTGSLVMIAYGARFTPGDLDITPALDDDNRKAFSSVAEELEAIPLHVPGSPQCPPLEWHYEWSPRPSTTENLDYLYVTTVGQIDFVPSLCGTYEDLLPHAASLDVGGHEVWVADPRSVLDRLEGRNRRKDQARRSEVERVRNAVEGGTAELTGLGHLL